MTLAFVTRRCACALLLLMIGVVPSAAQNSVRFTLGAGATVQHDETGANLPGFRVDVGLPLGGHVLAVGDVDVTRQLDKKFYNTNLLGGLRLVSSGRIAVFGQFLIGVDRCCGIQAVSYAPGGGVDAWITKHLAIRAQVDVPWLRAKGVSYRQQFFTIGVVIPLSE